MKESRGDVAVWSGVYPPSEDTYLLLKNIPPEGGLALDVGTGSGIVAIELAKKGWTVIATDINPSASRNALENVRKKGLEEMVQVLTTDLLKFLRTGSKVDLVVFNAPYVPNNETPQYINDLSWHGGSNGREAIEEFLWEIESYELEIGCILLVQSSLSDIYRSLKTLRSMNYVPEVLDEESGFFEKIVLIRAISYSLAYTSIEEPHNPSRIIE